MQHGLRAIESAPRSDGTFFDCFRPMAPNYLILFRNLPKARISLRDFRSWCGTVAGPESRLPTLRKTKIY
jgi:hypothetical protein